MVDRDMVWKLGKLQSAYNELRFDKGLDNTWTTPAGQLEKHWDGPRVHKSFVFLLLIFKQQVERLNPNAATG